MDNGELEILVNNLKNKADELFNGHCDDGLLCEKCLICIETMVAHLRYEKEKEKTPL